jgi:hypothetical protein
MKKLSVILASLVLITGVSFASTVKSVKKQDDKSKAKTEKKATTSKEKKPAAKSKPAASKEKASK